MLLFLDDERAFNQVTWCHYPDDLGEIVVVRNFADFVSALNKVNEFQDVYFSFDHDLQDFLLINDASDLVKQYGENNPYGASADSYELTGKSCLKYLLDNYGSDVDFDKIFLHTKNHIAKEKMVFMIENHKRYLLDEALTKSTQQAKKKWQP